MSECAFDVQASGAYFGPEVSIEDAQRKADDDGEESDKPPFTQPQCPSPTTNGGTEHCDLPRTEEEEAEGEAYSHFAHGERKEREGGNGSMIGM